MYEIVTENNVRILPVMATNQEHVGRLKEVCPKPFITNVGPINAATAMTTILGKNDLPDLIVCIGSAGSYKLNQGEIYQASQVSSRVVDATAIGFPAGETPFSDLPAIFDVAVKIPGIKQASLNTGGDFIAGGKDAFAKVPSDMADMEAYAIETVAARFGIPTVHLRGISDGKEESKKYEDWDKLLPVLGDGLGAAFNSLVCTIEEGKIAKVPHLIREAITFEI